MIATKFLRKFRQIDRGMTATSLVSAVRGQVVAVVIDETTDCVCTAVGRHENKMGTHYWLVKTEDAAACERLGINYHRAMCNLYNATTTHEAMRQLAQG